MSRKESGPAGTNGAAPHAAADSAGPAGSMVPWTTPGAVASPADDAHKGTAAANPVLVVSSGDRALRTPEQIEAELTRTRADLERTLDELSARLNPRTLVRRAGLNARSRVVDPTTGRPSRTALAAAAGTVAVAVGAVFALRALKRRRA